MKNTEVLRIGAMWTAMLAMALPTNVLGATPNTATSTRSVVRDVAMGQDGVLNGRVVDAQGKTAASASVLVHRDGRLVARTTTNADGQFSAQSLSSGVYQVTTGSQQRTYRVWSAQTAPPAAASAIQLTSGEVVRGQCTTSCGDAGCTSGCGGGGCSDACGLDGCSGGCAGGGCTGSLGCGGFGHGGLLGSPALIAAGIAAAIAIPIALADDDAS